MMIVNAYHTPQECIRASLLPRAGSAPPAVALSSVAQSGSDDMLWEAKLVTFSSPWRGVLLAQLAACKKGQATDPAFPVQWGEGGQERTPSPAGTKQLPPCGRKID